MVDLSNKTIKELFYSQVKNMTKRTCDTFDLQFSDAWIKEV